MTLPSEQIPADLREAAEACWFNEIVGITNADKIILVVARALMAERQKATEAERERCADICQAYADEQDKTVKALVVRRAILHRGEGS